MKQRESYFWVKFSLPSLLKVMLHGTIRNDDFLRNTALQCCNHLNQFRNNVAKLCRVKNRCCESSRVKSP